MSPRDKQIERVVKKMTADFWADGDGCWEKEYDLDIYPIENDISPDETDMMIRVYLNEEPHAEEDDV